jgi:putative addiction module killer protein
MCQIVFARIQLAMFIVKRLPEFDAWMASLRDGMTKRRLAVRLRKAQLGNLGDVKPVGDGVYEMREFFGPGWRMYYAQRGSVLIVMLGGGEKSSQATDIATAIRLANQLEE